MDGLSWKTMDDLGVPPFKETSKYFLFLPLLGGMIQFDEHIFQLGWWKTTN